MNRFNRRNPGFTRQNLLRPSRGLVNLDEMPVLLKHESLTIFSISLIFNAVLAYFLNFVWVIGNSDAISRTANAYYVLYSRDPHLAAVGFVWPPLLSFLELPLLPLTRFLGLVEHTGVLVSMVAGAATLVVLNRLLVYFKFSRWQRWGLLLLVQLHPDTWYLFASGMAEPVFLFLVVGVLYGMVLLPNSMRSWVIVGLGLALSFLIRYEALAMMAGVGLAIIIHFSNTEGDWQRKAQGWLLAVMTPPVYAVALWVFFNWSLMGDPLYFANSVYSLSNAPDIAKVAGMTHPLFLAWGNVVEAVRMGVMRSLQQSPAYPIGAVLAGFAILVRKDRRSFGVFIVMISITAFTILQVFLGSLANWMRYWFYAATFAPVMAGISLQHLKRGWRNIGYAAAVVLCLAAIPISLNAMGDSRVGADEQRLSALILAPEESEALKQKDGYWIYLHDAPTVAESVDKFSADGLVLVDSSSSFSVIMSVKQPKRLFISNDTDYFKVLANPIGTVKYILVLDPSTEGAVNTINLTYPTLFEQGASWARLVWDSGDETINHWRIYEIASEN